MPSLRYLCALIISSALCTIAGAQSKTKELSFPSDEEIRLVLTQADRAVVQYKPLLNQEEKLLGKEGEVAVAKDREVIAGLELAIKAFGKNPQSFNGPLGFSFFEWLDDASRNAMLCSSHGVSKSVEALLDGNKEAAESELQLSQSCNDVSTLLYTVSENAGALYTRYVEAAAQLAERGAEAAAKCGAILKQKGIVYR